MRSTRLLIDLDIIKNNIKKIKDYIGNSVDMMPIVKAYGYGSYINECPDLLNEFDYVGVALLSEAIALRESGYKNNIVILYPLSKEEYELSKTYDFIINGCNIFLFDDISKTKIHVEIDTGMGRTGIQINDVDNYISKLKKNDSIIVDGIFTHLSTNKDQEFSNKQLKAFDKVIKKFNDNGINPSNIHAISSGGLKYYKDYLYNMVRIGLLMYGYYPNDSLKDKLQLEPSITLVSKISYLKTIEKNDTVGYNHYFVADKKTVVATIPFGFGDGLLTLEPTGPYVMVNNKKAKIIGICMDNMMLDVTDIPDVKEGQEVFIWDNKNLTIDEVGKWCNDICAYEVLTSISPRVPRIFK